MILTATSQLLELVLSAAGSVEWTAAWTNILADDATVGADSGVVTTTTAAAVLPAPAASAQRRLEVLSLFNGDVAPITLTLRLNNGGSYRRLWLGTIPPGGTLSWSRSGGWSVPGTGTAGSALKQLIINPQMDIDQRNAGALVTVNAINWCYHLDRWATIVSQTGKLQVQQQACGLAGVAKCMRLVVASAVTPAAGDYFGLAQVIEGYTAADLAWGTASARAATLTFRARASIAGTYSLAITSGGGDRSYVAPYAIATAGVWHRITVTIPGCPDGTWPAGSSQWGMVRWDLGDGSSFATGSPGTWLSGAYLRATGSVQLVANAGATLDLTDARLYAGNAAPDYDQRLPGIELAMCQRYFHKSYQQSEAPGSVAINSCIQFPATYAGGEGSPVISFPVVMRASPTLVFYSPNTGTAARRHCINSASDEVLTGVNAQGDAGFAGASTGHTVGYLYRYHYTAAAEI